MDIDQKRPAFGQWLLRQKGLDGPIGDLATLASTDRSFPRAGSPKDVRHHMNRQHADPMIYEVIDEAETDWLSIR